MEIKVELLQITRTPRLNGELAYTVIFVEPYIPIKKATEKEPVEARIVLTPQGTPQQIALPYEMRALFHFGEQEWETIREKLIVGKEYNLEIDKTGKLLIKVYHDK